MVTVYHTLLTLQPSELVVNEALRRFEERKEHASLWWVMCVFCRHSVFYSILFLHKADFGLK